MKKHILLLLSLFFALYASRALINDGYFPMQDDMQAFRVHQMFECFKDFQIPCRWVPDMGYQYGYPQFNFYSPSVYYVGGLLRLFGLQFIDIVKTLFVFGFVLGGVAMFLLGKEFAGNKGGALASILFTLAPYRAQQVYVRGSLSEFFVVSLYPLLFWTAYKAIKNDNKRYLFLFSVSVGLLITTHNLLSFLFLPVLIVWASYWLLSEKKTHAKKTLEVFSAFLIGIGLSAFFFLPALIELPHVHADSLLSGYFDYRQHFLSIRQILFSNDWGYGSSVLGIEKDLALNSGIVHLLFGFVTGTVSIVSFKKNKKMAIIAILLLAIEIFVLFLMHPRSIFIWEMFSQLKWLQFPWRLLGISVFLLSLISSFVIAFFGRYKLVILTIAATALLILHGSFFAPKEWLEISDRDKFGGASWEKQLTISIFDYLPVSAKLPPTSKAPDFPEILEGEATFSSYQKRSNYQSGEIINKTKTLVRLPIFDFPGMSVYVDGRKVGHNVDCRDQEHCLGLVTVYIDEAGEHTIKVILEDTTIRKFSNAISLVSLGGLAYLLIRKNDKNS